MRASFLLVLAVALLVGLGVAVFIKNAGLLFPQPAAPVAVQPLAVVPPPPQILVASRSLFAGDSIGPGDVRLRPATAAEAKELASSPDKFLPAVQDVAYFRYIAKNVEANAPVLRESIEPMKKPEALNVRLPAGTKAVGVAVPKERCAGGLVQVLDYVDVYLTTEVGRSDAPGKSPRTALIAKNALVVVKRNSLYPVYAPLMDDLVQFTLAVNPYRAALVEHAMTVGNLTLVPANEAEKATLDQIKAEIGKDADKAILLSCPAPDSPEYREELRKVAEYTTGKVAIGTEQLMAVMGLKAISPPTRPSPPITVQVVNGSKATVASFAVPTDPNLDEGPTYVFSTPAGPEKAATGGKTITPPTNAPSGNRTKQAPIPIPKPVVPSLPQPQPTPGSPNPRQLQVPPATPGVIGSAPAGFGGQ